ncbi:MAG: YcxB family protein [Planctomycetota bacterium]|nr:YcxB family protein [Planctomycetota bacterium]
MTDYTFKYTISVEEFKAFQTYWKNNQSFFRRSIFWIFAVIFFILGVLVAIDPVLNSIDTFDLVFGLFWSFSSFLLSTYFLFRNQLVVHFSIRRLQREGSELFKSQELFLTPEHVESRTALETSQLKWQAIFAFKNNENAFYLFLDKNRAIMLPLRVICDAGYEPENVLRDIKAWRAGAPSREMKCPTCDYELKGISVQGCPECGWAREAEDKKS